VGAKLAGRREELFFFWFVILAYCAQAQEIKWRHVLGLLFWTQTQIRSQIYTKNVADKLKKAEKHQ